MNGGRADVAGAEDGGGDDPHDLIRRFVEPQLSAFETALGEIRRGSKEGCWMWFVLPTAPHVVDGVERGSRLNRAWALRGDDAAAAYLRLPPQPQERRRAGDDGEEAATSVDLRGNYLRMAREVRSRLEAGATLGGLFGPVDAPKARSSLELFRRVAADVGDDEVASACGRVLDFEPEGSSAGGGGGVFGKLARLARKGSI
ncbi:hypothetical protein ACHAWF_011083 [Thalassiosira exigua]